MAPAAAGNFVAVSGQPPVGALTARIFCLRCNLLLSSRTSNVAEQRGTNVPGPVGCTSRPAAPGETYVG